MQNTQNDYGWLTISVHWLVALVLLGLFGLGYWMVDLGYYDSWYKTGPALHKSIGITLFGLMLFRVIWRARQIQPTPLANHTAIERKLGHIMHRILYMLIFLILLSGYLISTADERGVSVFGLFEVPGFGSLLENQEDLAGVFHQYAAYLLIGMVLLHGGAAFKHHWIDKDDTLSRMLGKR